MARSEWLWIIGIVAAAVIGIVGRAYIYHRAQSRKECRDGIERITSLIHSISEIAMDYYGRHCTDPECPKLARQITSRLKEVGHRATRFNIDLPTQGLMIAVVRFRQAVSDELDSQSRTPCPLGDPALNAIHANGQTIVIRLETAYQRKYGGMLW